MVKCFVLDTNIILSGASSLLGFDDNHVILTGTTPQELDSKKKLSGEIGYNAREAVRILDVLRERGNLRTGVVLDNGGVLSIEPNGVRENLLPDGYSLDVPDNRILSTCLYLNDQQRAQGLGDVILVTNDVSMRVNAAILGLRVEGYRNEQIESSDYTGHKLVEAAPEALDVLYRDGRLETDEYSAGLFENQFVTFRCGQASALTVYRNGAFYVIREQKTFGGTKPLNAMQSYAIWALKAPASEIPLVILTGCAGTAKTFLSLAVGMEYTYNVAEGKGMYNKILLSRPNGVGFSNIGFLPGDLDRKLSPLMASYYDNMEILMNNYGKMKESREQIQQRMNDILETGVVELCSLDFIRGRSLQETYIICDEAQNATRGLIRDVVSRAGYNSKVIVLGDPWQIDLPQLDKKTNGLVYAAEAMKGSKYAAVLHLDSRYSVRSALAKEAIERMRF